MTLRACELPSCHFPILEINNCWREATARFRFWGWSFSFRCVSASANHVWQSMVFVCHVVLTGDDCDDIACHVYTKPQHPSKIFFQTLTRRSHTLKIPTCCKQFNKRFQFHNITITYYVACSRYYLFRFKHSFSSFVHLLIKSAKVTKLEKYHKIYQHRYRPRERKKNPPNWIYRQ